MRWNMKKSHLIFMCFVLLTGKVFADGFLGPAEISEDLAAQKQKLAQLILSKNANQLVCEYVPLLESKERATWITLEVDEKTPSNVSAFFGSKEKGQTANILQLSVGDSIILTFGVDDRRRLIFVGSKTLEGVEYSAGQPVFLGCQFSKR